MAFETDSAAARSGRPDSESTFASWGEPTTPPATGLSTRLTGSASRLPSKLLLALTLAAVAVGVVVLALGGGTSASAGGQTLQASSFTTTYPAGWRMTVLSEDGVTEYQLSSTAAKPDGYGIPPVGGIAITVAEAPASFLASHSLTGGAPDVSAASQSASELLPNVVGMPATAQNATTTTAAHTAALGGSNAAAATYEYTYAGVQDVQSDILARRGTDIVTAESDTEPSLEPQASTALASIIANWHWK